jgi:hypothetical protein
MEGKKRPTIEAKEAVPWFPCSWLAAPQHLMQHPISILFLRSTPPSSHAALVSFIVFFGAYVRVRVRVLAQNSSHNSAKKLN